jgi:hypothetical protein
MAIRSDGLQPDTGTELRVEVQDADGVALCTIAGCADAPELNRLAGRVDELRRHARHVVLDLDQLMLVHPEAISGFLTRLAGRGAPLVLCCARLSGRRLLRRFGAGRVGAVVPTVEEALHLLDPARN